MGAPVLNPAVIRLDIYSSPVILVGLATLALAIIVFVVERGSRLGLRYFIFASSVALYVFAAGVSYAVVGRGSSLLWDRIAHVGVAIIPWAILSASARVLGRIASLRFVLIGAGALSTLFATASIFTDTFVSGNQRVFWAYYPRYGPLGLAFVGYFAAVMIAVLLMHIAELRSATDARYRKRLATNIVAIAIGMVGAVDYLPVFGVEIYAFGYLPIFVFVALTGYVLMRYRLVDITPELAATPILNTMDAAVVVTDRGDTIRVANPTAHRFLGFERGRLLELKFSDVRETAGVVPASGRRWEEVWHDGAGTARTVSISCDELQDRRGARHGWVYVGHDITARKRAEAELQEQALHDPLTGLANRTLFFDRLDYAVAVSQRTGENFALFFVDLDQFKQINDTLGHAVGDAVLQEVALRMRNCFRESDSLARIGGDEFVGMCARLAAAGDAVVIAQKMLTLLLEPVDVDGHSCLVGASIGIAVFPADGRDADTLIAAADQAMYVAKHRHGGGYVLATEVPAE